MTLKSEIKAKLDKKGISSSRTGGKGSARRKRKAPRKSTSSDDKKLQTQLKKLGVSSIPAIEEVNLFKKDAKVIHFQNPRVQASIAANTYVVAGKAEEKELSELLPSILPQLGPSALDDLKHLVSQDTAADATKKDEQHDEDEIPDLVEATNFEDFSKGDEVIKEEIKETVEIKDGKKVETVVVDEVEQVD